MPNVGPVEICMLVLIFGIPIGIGYWCMRVFRRKLRSSGSGFALGVLPHALPLAHRRSDRRRHQLRAAFPDAGRDVWADREGLAGQEDHLRQSGLRAGTGRQSQRSGRALVRRAGVHRVGQWRYARVGAWH